MDDLPCRVRKVQVLFAGFRAHRMAYNAIHHSQTTRHPFVSRLNETICSPQPDNSQTPTSHYTKAPSRVDLQTLRVPTAGAIVKDGR